MLGLGLALISCHSELYDRCNMPGVSKRVDDGVSCGVQKEQLQLSHEIPGRDRTWYSTALVSW